MKRELLSALGAAVLAAGTTAAVAPRAFGNADTNTTGTLTDTATATGGDVTTKAASNTISVSNASGGPVHIKSKNSAGANKTGTKQVSPAKGGFIRIHF